MMHKPTLRLLPDIQPPLVNYNLSIFEVMKATTVLNSGPCGDLPGLKPLTVSNLDYAISRYVFPVQFVLGVIGNSVNLVVLLSSGMKNQVS